jgi:hypothetical protein
MVSSKNTALVACISVGLIVLLIGATIIAYRYKKKTEKDGSSSNEFEDGKKQMPSVENTDETSSPTASSPRPSLSVIDDQSISYMGLEEICVMSPNVIAVSPICENMVESRRRVSGEQSRDSLEPLDTSYSVVGSVGRSTFSYASSRHTANTDSSIDTAQTSETGNPLIRGKPSLHISILKKSTLSYASSRHSTNTDSFLDTAQTYESGDPFKGGIPSSAASFVNRQQFSHISHSTLRTESYLDSAQTNETGNPFKARQFMSVYTNDYEDEF